jgi:hypothetical protein
MGKRDEITQQKIFVTSTTTKSLIEMQAAKPMAARAREY